MSTAPALDLKQRSRALTHERRSQSGRNHALGDLCRAAWP